MAHQMQLRSKTKKKQSEQPDETKQQEQASKYNVTDIVGFTMFLNDNQKKHPICIIEDVGVDYGKPDEVWYGVRHLNVNETIDLWIENAACAKPSYLKIEGLPDTYGFIEESDIKYICDWPNTTHTAMQAMAEIIQ